MVLEVAISHYQTASWKTKMEHQRALLLSCKGAIAQCAVLPAPPPAPAPPPPSLLSPLETKASMLFCWERGAAVSNFDCSAVVEHSSRPDSEDHCSAGKEEQEQSPRAPTALLRGAVWQCAPQIDGFDWSWLGLLSFLPCSRSHSST